MDIKLNLGCGNKKIDGFLGIDRFLCKGADIIADINLLPFKESTVSEILLDNVIEHIIDIPGLMKELYRVLENNGILTIKTPHFTSFASWKDPTHFHHLSYFSFDYFNKDSTMHYIGVRFQVVEKKLNFGGLWSLMGKLIFTISPKVYEKYFCFIFKAGNLTFILKTIKEV